MCPVWTSGHKDIRHFHKFFRGSLPLAKALASKGGLPATIGSAGRANLRGRGDENVQETGFRAIGPSVCGSYRRPRKVGNADFCGGFDMQGGAELRRCHVPQWPHISRLHPREYGQISLIWRHDQIHIRAGVSDRAGLVPRLCETGHERPSVAFGNSCAGPI